MEISNDKKLLTLLQIKKKDYSLTYNEKVELKRLEELHKLAVEFDRDDIIPRLSYRNLVYDANITGEIVLPDGSIQYQRSSQVRDFRITEAGLEELRFLMSERMDREGSKKRAKNTQVISILTLVLSAVLVIIEVIKCNR